MQQSPRSNFSKSKLHTKCVIARLTIEGSCGNADVLAAISD
ncbi:hypothetical protein NK6_2611 [Bradyrhizobium diazoefficiens]|uniref:Uncharacterized protein n=1 Tax=Bradyrhizobium diazoefficiens TaxID=1355477 RepID=A0A0E4BMZ5_9BRAD|nr:hypothetical protein NK6_2611 [Bradyrhizobium diazoefficiens]